MSDFDAVYRAEYARQVRLARLLIGSPAVAEEIAQEAFIVLHRDWSKVQQPGAYVCTATVNLCRNWHRSQRRESARLLRHGLPAANFNPAAREMDAVINALPYRQRAVLVLRYWLDWTEADIASALECRPGTVKSLHSRALTTLRKELDDVH